jgi:hypothetical protein
MVLKKKFFCVPCGSSERKRKLKGKRKALKDSFFLSKMGRGTLEKKDLKKGRAIVVEITQIQMTFSRAFHHAFLSPLKYF